jgi:2-oxoglutarate dehydrogenase complex dehydrogenase (E1) component-like enzyme
MSTPEELQKDLEPRVLAGLGGDDLTRGRAFLGRLIPYWLDEARAGGDQSADVLAILRGDLERDAGPLAPRDRVVFLEAEVLDRELRALSNESFALGKQVVDRKVADDEAKRRGRELLSRVEALSPKVDAITLEAKRVPLRRQVEDVLLEALYAVERRAMSPRLDRYAQDQRKL